MRCVLSKVLTSQINPKDIENRPKPFELICHSYKGLFLTKRGPWLPFASFVLALKPRDQFESIFGNFTWLRDRLLEKLSN